jgi:hypothetical protein
MKRIQSKNYFDLGKFQKESQLQNEEDGVPQNQNNDPYNIYNTNDRSSSYYKAKGKWIVVVHGNEQAAARETVPGTSDEESFMVKLVREDYEWGMDNYNTGDGENMITIAHGEIGKAIFPIVLRAIKQEAEKYAQKLNAGQ